MAILFLLHIIPPTPCLPCNEILICRCVLHIFFNSGAKIQNIFDICKRLCIYFCFLTKVAVFYEIAKTPHALPT